MKKSVRLLKLLVNLVLSFSVFQGLAQDMVITGILDGPLTRGTPKCVELYVINDVADLSTYGLGSANNGGGSDGQEFTFPPDPAPSGSFIYVATENTYFTSFFGFAPHYTTNIVSINGDDAIELFHQTVVIDVFGDIDTDGTGQLWEYTDGWAYRKNMTGPDSSDFIPDHWIFSGPNALDEESSNATADLSFPVTSYVSLYDPEPVNHVIHLEAVSVIFNRIQLSWKDTTTTNQPSGYLVKGGKNGFGDITPPVDGMEEKNDMLVRNLPSATDGCLFFGLSPSVTYYFKIYPYSNSGKNINYKNDASVPEISCTTASSDTIILFEDFETGFNWMVINSSGDKKWTWASRGADQTMRSACISGLSDGTEYNTDWLISPPVNLDAWSNEILTFYSWWNYGNNDSIDYLKLYYSTDYCGDTAKINGAHWYEIPFSSGNKQSWNTTHAIDLSAVHAPTAHLAFKYRSKDSARTWYIDEILLKGNFTGDLTAPVFLTGSPGTDDIRENGMDVVAGLNETGKVFFLLKNNGDPSPTRAEVRLGETLDITIPYTDFRITIDTLQMAAGYDIYFLAQDTSGNIQDTTTLVKVTTLDIRDISLLYPEGGETFYANDSIWIRWSAQHIDSLQLFVYNFAEKVWFNVFGDGIKVPARKDSLKVHIPQSAGPDSSYFRLTEGTDFSFYDSCEIFHLVDTISPDINHLYPANNSTNVPVESSVTITFNEHVMPGIGFIVIWNDDRTEWDSIDVTGDQLTFHFNQVEITPGKSFRYGSYYFILADPGTFTDNRNNAFGGIKTETTWSFRTESAVEVSTVEDLRKGNQDDTVYKLAGEAIVTAATDSGNNIFIQDATAGIMISDTGTVITTVYTLGDGISGIVCKVHEHDGMLQLIPVEDPGTASSTGNTTTPDVLPVAEYKANYENYESQLIRLSDIRFADVGSTFINGTNYNIIQGADTLIIMTYFHSSDLAGSIIPEYASVTGIAIENNGTPVLAPRFLSDIDAIYYYTDDTDETGQVRIFPNPGAGVFTLKINSCIKADFEVVITNLNGQTVYRNLYRAVRILTDQIDLSGISPGIYIIKINSDEQLSIDKIIIE